MAIAPLFVADMTTLKSRIRMTGVPAGVDADAMFQQAVMDARLGFLDYLGEPRCTVLIGYTHTDTPLTLNEQLRALAESTEIKWVRKLCMATHPTAFIDGQPLNQVWNQEAAFRGASPSDLTSAMNKLENEIQDALEKLAGKVEQESEIRVSDIGPTCKPTSVGLSPFADRRGDPWR